MREPTRYEAANAVGEAASKEIELVEAMVRGDMIGPDPEARRKIEWHARCLVAAHAELRALIQITEGNAKRRAAG